MDLAPSQQASSARLPSLSRKIWMVYGAALALLALLTTQAMAYLMHHGRLLEEISTAEVATLAALQGQASSMALAIFVFGLALVVGLTFIVVCRLRTQSLAPSQPADLESSPRAERTGRDDSEGQAKASRTIRFDPPLSPDGRGSRPWEETMRLREERPEAGERTVSEAVWTLERIELLRRVREQATELVAAHEEIARSARAKDEFVASMSHELRTPLHAVLGLSEALRDEVHGRLSDQQRKFLRHIEDSGRQLLGLVNDILDIARVGTEELQLDLDSVAVADLCHSSIAVVTELAGRKGLSLEAQIDPQVETIEADEHRFQQILVNLLSNAVKFTPEGGTVGLKVEGDTAGGVARFTVWDTGIGIAHDDLQRLFRPFVQVDGRRARQYAGTGLGLSLAYYLADLHLGGICVESRPGEGSWFSVVVPWSPGARLAPELPDRSGPSSETSLEHTPLVLLLAHNRFQINVLATSLKRWGARVVAAENSRQAMALVRQEPPSLILLKPRLSGAQELELVEAVRDDARLRHLPIVALSALSMPGERERCLAAGVDEYLTLPMRDGELLTAIQNLLGRKPRCQNIPVEDEVARQLWETAEKRLFPLPDKCRSNSDAG